MKITTIKTYIKIRNLVILVAGITILASCTERIDIKTEEEFQKKAYK